MTDAKPVMLGYFVRTWLMSATQEGQARKQLLALAERQGHQMPKIFVDDRHGQPTARVAMVAFALREQVAAIAILGPEAGEEVQRHPDLAAAGIRVLIADPSP